MQYLLFVWAWVLAHPAILWPVVTAIVTTLFKPRSPEEYSALAANWPRLAKVLRLIGALGLDAPKVLSILVDLVKPQPPAGNDKAPPPGPGAGGLLLVMVAIAAPFVMAGNTSCAAFREDAKTVLDIGKIACIIANQTLPDSKVAEACDIVGPLLGPMQDVLNSTRAATKAAVEKQERLDAQRARAGCGGYRDGGLDGGAQ